MKHLISFNWLPEDLGKYVMPFLTVMISAILLLTIIQTLENKTFSEELRNGIVANCEQNGNKLREVSQVRIKEEIKQTNEEIPLFKRLFPNFPEKELENLIKVANKNRERELKEIMPIDCTKVYP